MDEEENEELKEELDDSKTEFEKQEEQRSFAIHAVVSFVAALCVVLIAVCSFIVLVKTKKDPKQVEGKKLVTAVRVEPIRARSHEVSIETQGVVSSLREVMLAAEVGGRVTTKSDQLVAGEMVKEGEVLIEIESSDYKAAEARANSALADAELALEQEQAMAEQAVIDWKKLGRGEPTDLVLRVPQLKAAEARVKSAEAEQLRAKRDVERTIIRAPFDARIRRVQVEVGAVLGPGTVIAELYSTQQLEVRLPFSLLDYGFLVEGSNIQLTATVGGEEKTWPAVLDRVDGEVQRTTLSAYGLAKLDHKSKDLPPVGLFVEAKVPGKTLDGVVVLPRSAVRGSNDVWVVQKGEEGHELVKRQIDILRTSRDEVVARGDFEPNDQLVLTRLAAPMNGMKVEPIQEEEETPETP